MKPKFRAWDKDSQKMNGNVEIYINKDKTIEVRPKDDKTIIMQSAGLKDKNGKEIYEGDIVKFHDECQSYTGVVTYMDDYACFVIMDKDRHEYTFEYIEAWYCLLSELEIIGNEFEVEAKE